jgi:hypothetical protein
VTRVSSYQLLQAMETSGLPYLEVTMPVNISSVPVMGWVPRLTVGFALPLMMMMCSDMAHRPRSRLPSHSAQLYALDEHLTLKDQFRILKPA